MQPTYSCAKRKEREKRHQLLVATGDKRRRRCPRDGGRRLVMVEGEVRGVEREREERTMSYREGVA